MSELRLLCPSCKIVLKVGEANAGQAMKCPKCGNAFRVSAASPPSTTPQPVPTPRPASPSGQPAAGQVRKAAPAKPAPSPQPAAAAESGPGNVWSSLASSGPSVSRPRRPPAKGRSLALIWGLVGGSVLLVAGVVIALITSGVFSKKPAPLVASGEQQPAKPAAKPDAGKPDDAAKPKTTPAPAPSAPLAQALREQILGKWESQDKDDKGSLEFRPDGTMTLAMEGGPPANGTYRILDGETLEVRISLGDQVVTQKLRIKASKDNLVTTDESNKVDRFRRSTGVAARPGGAEDKGGHATPDAAMDAYVKAMRDLDVAAYKKLLAKNEERLSGEQLLIDQQAKDKPPAEVEAAWKGLLQFMRDNDWVEGKYKRFTVEQQGEDKAFIVCVYEWIGPASEPDHYRKYELTKLNGRWYQTAWTYGIAAKDLDPAKYAWDKGERSPAKPAPGTDQPAKSAPPAPAPTVQPRAVLKGHTKSIRAVALTKDGKVLASAGDDPEICLWGPATGEKQGALTGLDGGITALAISPDGKTLVSGDATGKVMLWDLRARKKRFEFVADPLLSRLAFSPDGKALFSDGVDSRGGKEWNQIKLWKVAPAAVQLQAVIPGRFLRAFAMAVAPDGKTVAVGDARQGEIVLYSVAQRKELAALRGHRGRIMGLAFSPDGKTLASCSGIEDGTAKLWDLAARKPRVSVGKDLDTMEGVAFSPNGKVVALALYRDNKNLIKLLDAASGRELAGWAGHEASINALLFTADSSTLISGSADTTIKLWDVAKLLPGK